MHIFEHAATKPRQPAIIMAESGETWSFAELERRSNQSAHQLRELGLKRGDVVASLFANAPEVFELGWAAQRAGLYQTAISNKLSAADIGYILRDSGAKVLIVSDVYAELARQALADLPLLPAFRWNERDARFGSWRNLAAAQPKSRITDESAGSDLLYSSGTTGRPKGVMPPLPSGPIEGDTALMRMGTTLYGMGAETRYLSTSPLYHAAPLRWAMTVLQLGGTVVIMERFDAEQVLSLVEKFGITHGTFVPTHFVRMLKLPDQVRQSYDVGTLRAVIHAAAPCPVPVKAQMIDWFGPIIHEYYSGTESCGITALNSDEWLRKPGSVGRAVLGSVRITDDHGNELPSGEVGQVFFADGPRFAYLNDARKTAEAYNSRGWATLGDIGKLDEDGYLYLTDRKSFMIISGGVNIYPQEIENLLITHPEVADAAVIGVPDEEMGERVVAVVQPALPGQPDDGLAARLISFARENLGGVKTPRQIDFVAELPREPTGKLIKRKIREDYLRSSANP